MLVLKIGLVIGALDSCLYRAKTRFCKGEGKPSGCCDVASLVTITSVTSCFFDKNVDHAHLSCRIWRINKP